MTRSMYAKYKKERENKEILESEIGFDIYFFENDYVYIEDIFVEKEYRKGKEASRLADEVAKIAKEKGINKMLGSVRPSSKGSTSSLKVLLGYGFKLASSHEDAIYFIKDI